MNEEDIQQIYNYELGYLKTLQLDHETTAELASRLNNVFTSESRQMLISYIEYINALEKAIKTTTTTAKAVSST